MEAVISAMKFNPVCYGIMGDEVPALEGKAYGYVLAGNGVFKRAENSHFDVCVPISRVRVAGLPEIRPWVKIRHGRIPERLLLTTLEDARRQAAVKPVEAGYHYSFQNGMVRLTRPVQTATADSLQYLGGDGPETFCDLHSHCNYRAFFSGTDNKDELGFRFYAVMGLIFERQPEIRVRLGIYGDFVDLPATVLFGGIGEMRDMGEFSWSR